MQIRTTRHISPNALSLSNAFLTLLEPGQAIQANYAILFTERSSYLCVKGRMLRDKLDELTGDLSHITTSSMKAKCKDHQTSNLSSRLLHYRWAIRSGSTSLSVNYWNIRDSKAMASMTVGLDAVSATFFSCSCQSNAHQRA